VGEGKRANVYLEVRKRRGHTFVEPNAYEKSSANRKWLYPLQ
jgi:hypothetical protein